MRGLALGLCLTAAVGFAADPVVTQTAEASEPRPKRQLSFMGLTAQSGVSEERARHLSSLVAGEVAATGVYAVTSSEDIEKILGVERQRQLMGCTDADESCLAEIAGALNADRLLAGAVQHIDDTFVVTLSLIDPRSVRVVARGLRKVDESGLIEGIQSLVYEVVNQEPDLQGRTVKPEKQFGGLAVGIRVDVDVLGFRSGDARALPIAPGITLEYAWKWFGVAVTLFPKVDFGGRVEARFYPFRLKTLLRPHLAVGTTVLLSGISGRGAVGATLKLGSLQVTLDAGYERFASFKPGYEASSVAIGLGAGWLF